MLTKDSDRSEFTLASMARACALVKGPSVAGGSMVMSMGCSASDTLFENETLTPEDPEVLDVGLLPGKDFIWSLVQDLAEIETIGSMTSGVDGFRPKVVGTLELRHHCPCRIN